MIEITWATIRPRIQEEDEEPEQKGQDLLVARILKTRNVLISGQIDKALVERVVRQLILLEDDSDDPIKVFIDSPGGDLDAGYAVFDMLRFVKPTVYAIGMGLVASAAAVVLLAADRDKRVGLPNSHYLIHQPLSGMRGVATEIEIHAKELEKARERINRLISEETGQPYEKVVKDTDRDFWMNVEEAKGYGLVSRIVSKREEL